MRRTRNIDVRLEREVCPQQNEHREKERANVRYPVCAIERFVNKEEKVDSIQDVFPVAGELADAGGKTLEHKWSLLKDSNSHEDSKKDGLLLELHGGFNDDEDKKNKPQKAIIEFICDKEVEGTENLYDPEDKYETEALRARAVEPSDDKKNGTCMYDLSFVRYDKTETINTLRLSWRTKWACENAKDLPNKDDGDKDGDDKKSSAHWGFFTWFILM